MNRQGSIFRSATGEKTIPFREAFPTIAQVEVQIHETGPGTEGLGVRRLVRRSVREWINCSNPDCHGKGLALGERLRAMVQKNQSHWTGQASCESRREDGTACINHFTVEIQMVFQPPAA